MLKRGTLAGVTVGVVALATIAIARYRADSPSRPDRIRIVVSSKVEPIPPGEGASSVPQPTQRRTSSAEAAPSAAEPTTPRQLRAWILSLPDSDFSPLIGTPTLDRYVSRSIADGTEERATREELEEMDRFLSRLNDRIRNMKSRPIGRAR